jgi:hypothetical protein
MTNLSKLGLSLTYVNNWKWPFYKYYRFNNIGLNYSKDRFLSLDHTLLTPAAASRREDVAAVWDNTAKIKQWKENRVCPLGRALICEEGRIPHCVIHAHVTHGRRHPLVSAGYWNSWRRSLSN